MFLRCAHMGQTFGVGGWLVVVTVVSIMLRQVSCGFNHTTITVEADEALGHGGA